MIELSKVGKLSSKAGEPSALDLTLTTNQPKDIVKVKEKVKEKVKPKDIVKVKEKVKPKDIVKVKEKDKKLIQSFLWHLGQVSLQPRHEAQTNLVTALSFLF